MLIQVRILIVKLSSIGDIVHTLPSLAAIKSKLPSAEISWAAERSSSEILRNNPLLTRLIEVDTRSLRRKSVLGKTIKTAKKQLRDLRASGFDLTIDFQGLLKSASIASLSGARFRAGCAKEQLREPASRHLNTHSFAVDSNKNVIFQHLQLAEKSIGAYLNDKEFLLEKAPLEFPISTGPEAKREAAELSAITGGDFVMLNPAGGWVTKLWPAKNYAKLADSLWNEYRLNSLICTAPNEKELANEILAAASSAHIHAVQPSLKAFVELAKLARGYVGGDTGPTHLAVAAGCPVVGIYGPTEWWRNGSPMPEDLCIGRNDIDCRVDCNRRTCGKWICMDIDVETVLLGIRTRFGL